MSRALDWHSDSRHWPHAAQSRFVTSEHLRWHVQCFDGPAAGQTRRVLLVHGTGASTHSWRHNAAALAEVATVLAVDLPGHAFTERPPPSGLSLIGMARRLAGLLETLDFSPDVVIGHSAGAAVLVRMALDGRIAPQEIISLNGALYPFRGAAHRLFPGIARALFVNPVVPWLFARGAGLPNQVRRLIEGTGSRIDADGLALYAQLFASPPHAGAALGMMAHWDLDTLDAELSQLDVPLTLVVGDKDRAVAPAQAAALARRLDCAAVVRFADVGHLAHEEDPARINALLIQRIQAHPRSAQTADPLDSRRPE